MKLEKVYELLKAIDGVKNINKIYYKIPMQYMTIRKYTDILRKSGIIEVKRGYRRSVTPKLTEKGRYFLNIIEEIVSNSPDTPRN